MPLQTVLVPRTWGVDEAVAWVAGRGYRASKVDAKGAFFRFRQHTPMAGARYYSKVLSNGVHLVFDDS